jgi:predicted nucleotidyltransferase component of viral defense system
VRSELEQRVRECGTRASGWAVMREFLQIRILRCLQSLGAMVPLAFHGGTALRLLHALPRYSEDLDFALERPGRGFDLQRDAREIRSMLEAEGYATDVKVNDARTVHGAFVRFPGLPHALGLSQQRHQVFAIKIEVDTRPPAGAVLATTIIRRYVAIHVQHHDPSSLLAGKLNAVLTRRYTKGRDIYDLWWYLADRAWPAPNLALLNNALRQSGWTGPALLESTWRPVVRQVVERLDWTRAAQDVRPFLQDPSDEALFSRESMLALLPTRPRDVTGCRAGTG